MQSIELHDTLALTTATETSFTTSGLPFSNERESSVRRAHAALERAAGKPLPGHLHLHKTIPPGSGMGGAGSDAAAALRMLKTMFELQIDLMPVAAELGADVPFFLHGGYMRAEGRGERLTPLGSRTGWFAVAWPGIELSTAAVYRAWDEVKGKGVNELQRAAEHVDPRVGDFARLLGEGWQMTGSGSAFFKWSESEGDARQAVAGLDCWTVVTHTVGPWA